MKTINDKIQEEVRQIFFDFSSDDKYSEQAVRESMVALSVLRQDVLFRTITVITNES